MVLALVLAPRDDSSKSSHLLFEGVEFLERGAPLAHKGGIGTLLRYLRLHMLPPLANSLMPLQALSFPHQHGRLAIPLPLAPLQCSDRRLLLADLPGFRLCCLPQCGNLLVLLSELPLQTSEAATKPGRLAVELLRGCLQDRVPVSRRGLDLGRQRSHRTGGFKKPEVSIPDLFTELRCLALHSLGLDTEHTELHLPSGGLLCQTCFLAELRPEEALRGHRRCRARRYRLQICSRAIA
mmetsp:Transcript_56972/g.128819  ORF Transcript_56972/g.128819 Transcript_56972/m.128819 type:complete len:238 (+) Transcript_56972:610-1323(+)